MAVTLDTPLTRFPGVGEVRAQKLEKLGLSTAAEAFCRQGLPPCPSDCPGGQLPSLGCQLCG